MIEKDRKCIHPGCGCPADPGSDYCSPYCQSAKGTHDDTCGCGHDACLEPKQPTRGSTPRGSYDPTKRTEDEGKPLMAGWGQGDKH